MRAATTEPAARLANVIATRTGLEHAATCVQLDIQAVTATQVRKRPLFDPQIQPFAKKDARTVTAVSLASVCAMHSATVSCATSATRDMLEAIVEPVNLLIDFRL